MGQAILGKLRYICQSAEAFSTSQTGVTDEFDFRGATETIGQQNGYPARLREERSTIAFIFHIKSCKIFPCRNALLWKNTRCHESPTSAIFL